MKYFVVYILLFGMFCACQNNNDHLTPSVQELKEKILAIDDSLHNEMKRSIAIQRYSFNDSLYITAIEHNKRFYATYPEHPFTEKALQKIAAIYLQLNQPDSAFKWRSVILKKYPNTKNKIGLLELQMNYYDLDNYSPEKIKFYGEKLLAIDSISTQKKEQIKFRLQHIDLTFEELIILQSQTLKSDSL